VDEKKIEKLLVSEVCMFLLPTSACALYIFPSIVTMLLFTCFVIVLEVLMAHAGFVLMHREKETDYEWVLAHIRKLFETEKIPFPRVIVTDRELVLTNAIDKVFTDQPCGRIYRLLCCWHVNQNILGHAKKHFRVGLNSKDEGSC